MTAWELLLALPAVRLIAAVCLILGTVCGAGAVLAFGWRRFTKPSDRLLQFRLADARAQVRDLLDQNKRLARLYAERQAAPPPPVDRRPALLKELAALPVVTYLPPSKREAQRGRG